MHSVVNYTLCDVVYTSQPHFPPDFIGKNKK